MAHPPAGFRDDDGAQGDGWGDGARGRRGANTIVSIYTFSFYGSVHLHIWCLWLRPSTLLMARPPAGFRDDDGAQGDGWGDGARGRSGVVGR